MLTTPSPDFLLEGVIVSLSNDVMPNLTNAKAQATVGMAQAVLQQVRQTLPHYMEFLADEHNGMTKALRDVAAALSSSSGPAAESLRARSADLGGRADIPAPIAPDIIMDAHRALSLAVVATMKDLDTLQRAGNADADAALQIIRAHLGPRYVRDVQTLVVGAGMIGRG